MAKSQHLAKLKLGTATWNHWRERNPQLGSGPQGANLTEAKLSKANLFRAKDWRMNMSVNRQWV
jgi:uncharacterized protein YjbI with pentapeptide repeats